MVARQITLEQPSHLIFKFLKLVVAVVKSSRLHGEDIRTFIPNTFSSPSKSQFLSSPVGQTPETVDTRVSNTLARHPLKSLSANASATQGP